MHTDKDSKGATETGEKKGADVEGQHVVYFLEIMNFKKGQQKMNIMKKNVVKKKLKGYN